MNMAIPYVGFDKDVRRVRSLWERFHAGLTEPSEVQNAYHKLLLAEWQRCTALGVDVAMTMARRLSDEELHARIHASRLLLETSVPLIDDVGRFLNEVPGLMLLTDTSGTVMHVTGTNASKEYAATHSGIVVGSRWDETAAGTNGMGTALSTRQPVHVFATEHFCEGWQQWSCSAAPIFDIDGQTVIGIIDFTTGQSDFRDQALALTVSLANSIQAKMDLHRQLDRSRLLAAFSERSHLYPRDEMLVVDYAERPVMHSSTDAGLEISTQWKSGDRSYGKVVHSTDVISPSTGSSIGRILHFDRSQPPGYNQVFPVGGAVAGHAQPFRFGQFISSDVETIKTLREIERVSHADVNVLLIGETGTGKELIARQIHASSPRKEMPYLAVNCGAISPDLLESTFFGYVRGAFSGADPKGRAGYFEASQGGTLFLDEVGELPLAMQAALLRVLEDGSFLRVGSTKPLKADCRVIAATHRNLEELVAQGKFRQDLYYRLKIVQRRIKPIRSRAVDVPILVNHFRAELERKHKLPKTIVDSSASSALAAYSWPGNAREIRNVMEAALLCADDGVVVADHLPPEVLSQGSAVVGVSDASVREPHDAREYERLLIIGLLRKYRKVNHVAKALGIARSTLYRKFDLLGIEQREYADERLTETPQGAATASIEFQKFCSNEFNVKVN
jgi:transcriptional regulator of acetoin/glycerol metabolism